VRSLRLVYVNHVAGLGGAEKSLLSLLRRLPALGVEAYAVVPPGPLSDRLEALGVPVTPIPPCRLHRTRNPLVLAGQFRWMRRLNAAVRRVCREVGADLVHANSLAAAVALAPRRPGLPPLLWHCRDLIHPSGVLRWLLPRCAGVIAISRVVERYLREAAPECAGRVRLVYNGIEPEDVPRGASREEVRRALGAGPETPVLVSVGQLTPWKNWDLLLEAAALVQQARPEARWWMVGEDTYGDNAAYARRVRAAAPGNVIFTGFREEAPDLIRTADVLVHAATAEPLGRVILEAMLLGTAVVAPEAGGIPELVETGRSGWLVPPGSAEALAGGALRLLGDKQLGKELASEAQERVLKRFSAERTAEETVRVYREVLGRDTGLETGATEGQRSSLGSTGLETRADGAEGDHADWL
jgi:glycosyltransferase involved in cell wall biosynthesis